MNRAASPPRLTAGRILYLAYYRPRAMLARSRREGGPWQQWLDARGRREMKAAATRLPPSPVAPASAPAVHVLTGRRFWYQTAFCIHSLRRHAPVRVVFVDDGTLDADLVAEAGRLFPDCRVLPSAEIEGRLDQALPRTRFPQLRRQRESYLHLRKLTDVHAGLTGCRVVLDADMLFFRRPDALLQWLQSPGTAVAMVDVQNSYGYPLPVLNRIAGRAVPERVNVGVLGLHSDAIDWAQLERWCTELLERHGSSYYLEQALVALLLAGREHMALPPAAYRVMPDVAECITPSAVLHHYVDLSKRGYFRHAWRHIGPA